MAFRKRINKLIPKIIGAALARIFGQNYESDTIILGTGFHEIEIPLQNDKKIDRVWVSFNNEIGEMQVCGGNVDTLGVVEKIDAFVLYADINSTSRTIRWFVSTSEKY